MYPKALSRFLLPALMLAGLLISSTNAQSTNFSYSGAVVTYTIPITGNYEFTVAGGAGGGYNAGYGAILGGDIRLSSNTLLYIVVGGSGVYDVTSGQGGGGGGGSFVYTNLSSPLIIAGGGGGKSFTSPGYSALTNNSGSGLGGGAGYGAGGAGFFGNGSNSIIVTARGGSNAPSFAGGTGTYSGYGAFGGGGAAGGDGFVNGGGGGGGYTGGNGGTNNAGGTGGSSYISGSFSNVFGTSGGNTSGPGIGYININYLAPTFNWVATTNSWSNDTNWSGGQVPASANTAYIDNGGTAILSSSGSVDTLYVGNTNTSAHSSLIISNGGSLSVTEVVFVGYNTSVNGNSVLVNGSTALATISNDLYLGASGASNSLIITNGGTMHVGIADVGLVVGSDASSSNNKVVVTGPQSLLTETNGGAFYLGYAGAGNSMIISNQGTVIAGASGLTLGQTNTSSNNSLLVTGTNTLLNVSGSSAALTIGSRGASNSLIISNGAHVLDADGYLGAFSSSSNNYAIVTGAGSLWSNSTILTVGKQSAGNLLVISNGGEVIDATGNVDGASGSSNNKVIVNNGTWSNSGTLSVGVDGNHNTLIVTNGGLVYSGSSTVGNFSGNTSNVVLLTSAGSTWSNSGTITVGNAGGGSLTVASGASLISSNITLASQSGSTGVLNIGTFGGADTNVTLNAQSISFGNGTGTVNFNQSDVLTNSSSFLNGSSVDVINQAGSGTTILTGVSSNGSQVDISGGQLIFNNAQFNNNSIINVGTKYTNSLGIDILSNSVPVSMVVTNNASVYANYIFIGSGYDTNGNPLGNSNNWVLVTGSNSSLNVARDISIGDGGNSNSLTITNGATVNDTNRGSSTVYVGYQGNSNSLFVASNSTLNASVLTIGYLGNSNSMKVAGPNAAVNVTNGGFTIGNDDTTGPANNNSLVVSNGGKIYGGYSGSSGDYIGYGGNSNSLVITGPGSLYSNNSALEVGEGDYYSASNNIMVISNGASAIIGSVGITVGYYAGDANNSIAVYGNSTLTVAGDTYIGYGDATSNSVSVTGTNSRIASAGTFYVGDGTSAGSVGNSLVISNGGVVNATGVDLSGGVSGDSNNFVLITGAGSKLSNSDTLTIGDAGSGSVTVATGSTLISSNITIASQTGSAGVLNIGTYSGSDTGVTLAAQTITFGAGMSILNFNQAGILTNNAVFNGTSNGTTFSMITQLGSGTTVLTGQGGTNYAGLVVNNGQLIVNGGHFTTVGFNQSFNSQNQFAGTVCVGLQATNMGFGGGYYSNTTGASMVVSNQGVVSATGFVIGYGVNLSGNATGNSNNSLLVTGSGSSLNGDIGLGYGGNFNTLIVTNGASIQSSYTVIGNGYGSNLSGGNNNSAAISGVSTSSLADTYVGYANDSIGGNSNSLSISGGATVSVSYLSIGYELYGGNFASGSGNGNSLIVSGGGILTNSGNFTVGNEEYGNGGNGNTVTVSNSTMFNNRSVIVGESTDDGFYTYKNPGGDSNRLALIASTFNANGIYIGYASYNTNGISGGDSNSMTVNASRVTNSGDLTIGFSDSGLGGNFNSLTLSNGAFFTNHGDVYIGENSSSNFNTANGNMLTISGASTLTAGGQLLVGSSDQYTTTNTVSANSVLVTGIGSSLNLGSAVVVGYGYYGVAVSNSLIITNGATATGLYLVLGEGDYGANISNSITIGANSSLRLTNGSYSSYISEGAGTNNTLLVTGSGATMSNAGTLYVGSGYGVGYEAVGNSLIISNGGSVTVGGPLYIGYNAGDLSNFVTVYGNSTLSVIGDSQIGVSGSSNTATVAGSNALWTNTGDIYLGSASGGSENSLLISNGGKVYTVNLSLGYGYPSGSNNSVLITGAGSALHSSGYIDVGYDGSGANMSLVVSNGAKLFSVTGIVGEGDGGSNNYITLTGTGSSWSNSGNITIGRGNSGLGAVNVENGASLISSNITIASQVKSAGVLNIGTFGGNDTGVSLNSPTITFGSGSGTLNFNQADTLIYSGSIGGGVSQTTNGVSQIYQQGSGTTIFTGYSTNIIGLYVQAGELLINGGELDNGTNAGNNGNITIGEIDSRQSNSMPGTMIISNQATVRTYEVNVGNGDTPYISLGYNSNSLVVTGTNTTLTVSAYLNVGNYRNTNFMTVSNGALVNVYQSYIGEEASGNQLIITGQKSLISNSDSFYIADYGGSNNSVLITNGGSAVVGNNLYVGDVSNSVNNSITVAGNSTLTVSSNAYIGSADASSNSIIIAGSNAVFNSGGVYIGDGTSLGSIANSLLISNSAISQVSGVIVGVSSNDSQNQLVITGTGSQLTSSGKLKVGSSGSSNSMVISGGGRLFTQYGYSWIGQFAGANGNSVLVTGPNSLWSNNGGLDIGTHGAGNSLVISNGGIVQITGDAYVGNNSGSSNNLLSIVGPGSKFLASGNLTVGNGIDANTLSLNNGASLSAASLTVFTNSTLTGNGTITDPTIDGGTFAPAGASALTLNGDLTFTNGGVYAWNLFNNSASTTGGTNFTVPVILNGNLSVTTNSFFDLTFGGNINQSAAFWTNDQQWLVTAGTNSLSAGTNFALAWATPEASAGFNLSEFSLSASNNNFYLNYTAPQITNPTIPAGTNALPTYNVGTNTLLVITAPTNGTAVLTGTNNTALTGIIVNSGTLASTNQNSIPTNASVTVYNGTMGFTGPGTNTIASLFVSGGSVAASNTIVNVQSFVQTGGTLSGGTNATYWAGNYYFAASNTATVDANLANLGTVANYHSTAVVTTNSSGAPAAPVVFANNMSYDGGTVITGGILQLGSGASTSAVSVQGTITNNGYLNYGYNGNSTTPTNAVIGSGVIGQVGTGTLTIGTNGIDNAFTGSFSAANGTLALGSNSALGASTNFYLASSGTLQATTGVTNITQSVNVTNGTGIIENASGITLALNGTLTKSGTVLVLAGGSFEVNGQVTGSGAPGSFDSDLVVSNAIVTLNSGNNNYSGPTYVVDGGLLIGLITNALPTNTVVIVGAATDTSSTPNIYTLSADQTLAGIASVNNGRDNLIAGPLSSTLATLTINGATNTTFSGGIENQNGILRLIRAGTGNTTLTGSNSYSGGTVIQSGSLTTVNVHALGSGTVALNGGTLVVRSLLNIGAMTWSGGQIALPTLTSTNGVYLVSTNGLTISGGSHVFDLSGASLTIGTPTRLLGATNMSTNSFTTNDFSVTGVGNYSLLISNDILWIDLLNNPAPESTAPVYPNFVSYAANRNQVNVATALNSFTNNPNADQTVVLTSLTALTNSPGSMQQAFNAIMPNFYQQLATIAFNSANAQNMELSQRLWGMRVAEGGGFSMNGFGDNTPMIQEGQGDGDGKGVLDAKKDILRPGLDNRWGMFLDANGIFAKANSGNMLPGYQSESGGVTTGLTYKWNKNVSSGIYAGYQGTYNKLGAAGSGLGVGSTLIDNAVRFGFFGTYGQVNSKGEPLGFYANALAGGAYNNYQASRIIQYPGINRTATSQPGAGELDSMIAGGYDLKAGNFTYGPSASLQYTYLGANGVNETGAQSLDYNSSGWNSSSMLSSVGAHGAYTWMVKKLEGHEVAVVPQISLNWQHEFMQNPYAINGNLGGTTPNFSNWSATPIRDFLYTGVGVTVEFAKRWNTSFFYNAAAGNKDLVSQSIFLSAGLKF
jgi:T5SS/PEP-CTERM-associated repeat protein